MSMSLHHESDRTISTSNIPDVAVIGYCTVDQNITPTTSEISPGGAAYFASLAATLAHSNVGLISTVGGDYYQSQLLNRLHLHGLHTIGDHLTARSTQTYFSDNDLTRRHISIEWGAAALLEGKHIPEEWFAFLRFIHVATMIPTQQFAIIDFIRRHAPQAYISIDTDQFLLQDLHQRSVIINNFETADLGFANRHEYEVLGTTLEQMPAAVVKLDADGAFYLENGQIIAQAQAPRVKAVDVTGAGDIFAGVFIGSLAEHLPPAAALTAATHIATQSVTRKGIEHLFSKGKP